jgi:hypothetical protein
MPLPGAFARSPSSLRIRLMAPLQSAHDRECDGCAQSAVRRKGERASLGWPASRSLMLTNAGVSEGW